MASPRRSRLDLSIGQRILVGFAAAGALVAVLVIASVRWIDHVTEVRARLEQRIAPRAAAADALQTAVVQAGTHVRGYVRPGRAEGGEGLRRALADVHEARERLRTLENDARGRALLEDVQALTDRFLPAAEAFATLLASSANERIVEAAERGLDAARDELLVAVRAYAAHEERLTAEARDEITAAISRMVRGLAVLAPVVFLLVAATAFYTARGVRRSALSLRDAARALGAGDDGPAVALAPAGAVPERRRDELAELSAAFGSMALSLRAREQRLQRLAGDLQVGSEKLQAQNAELEAQREALERQAQELRRAVQALTASVADRERAEEALREADRRKDEFLATLSHELRNPLAPIRNGLYVLERAAPGSDSARRARAAMDRQVRHLTRLVDDLLDVTRVSRGKLVLRRVTVNLVQTLQEAAEDVRGLFVARGIDLRVSLPGKRLWVNGDPARLAQIVGNLLHNAAKFTPHGGCVELGVEERDRTAVVRVRDTGAGIEPALLARIFDPFVQAEATLARTHGGLGLGLALVKALAEQHGGRVEASSPGAGKGSEFRVSLPLEEQPARAVPSGPAHGIAPRRILVVEDNADSAETLQDVLRLGGHAVAMASDGEAALRKAREQRPDAILCDIGLPGMSGYDVARAVRADEALRSTFLVALTGYALPEDRRRGADAGFDEYLAKPLTLERLEELLARVPAGQAVARDGGEAGDAAPARSESNDR